MFRFKIAVSDVDRGVYETLELRLAMHPSESVPYLLTRVIAYALNYQEGLELTQGIGTPDDPALRVKDLTGTTLVWIDVGFPTARRLHKAAKTAKTVLVYTYRDPQILLKEVEGQEVHKKSEIEVYSLPPAFLERLGKRLARDNNWELLHTGGELSVTADGEAVHGEVGRHNLR